MSCFEIGSARMLPGCGSPWKNPSTRTCLMIDRMNTVPSSVVSKPASRSSSAFEILMPLTNSIVMTRSPESSSYTSGTWISGKRCMPSARRRAW